MLRQSLIATALALAVVTASTGVASAIAATHYRASAGHYTTLVAAPREAPYQETGEISWAAIG